MFRFLRSLAVTPFLLALPATAVCAPSAQIMYHKGQPKIGSDAWIETKLRQYPELLWLANSSEGFSLFSSIDLLEDSELTVALRSLTYLHLLLSGTRASYSMLARLSSDKDSLPTLRQFQTLHKQLVRYLESPKAFDNSVKLLETAIILRNIGISKQARQIFQPYFSETDVRAFYDKALLVLKAFPNLSPSYSRLSASQREVFSSLRKLGNYGDLLSLIDSPSKRLLQLGKVRSPIIFLDLVLHGLDSFGLGKQREDSYQNQQAFASYLQQNASMEEAFTRYLAYRAERLGLEGRSRSDMALVRLSSLMKISSPAEASALSWSFRNLSPNEVETIVSVFYSASGEYLERNIIGLPELFSGLSAITSPSIANAESRLRQIYSAELSLLAKGLSVEKDMNQKQLLPKGVILNFVETASTFGGLNVFSDTLSVRVHLNGAVSVDA